jgi:hypothetical protein
MLEIRWTESVWEVFKELPARDQVPILKSLGVLPLLPEMYPIRRTGDFVGCRYFVAGEWNRLLQGSSGWDLDPGPLSGSRRTALTLTAVLLWSFSGAIDQQSACSLSRIPVGPARIASTTRSHGES